MSQKKSHFSKDLPPDTFYEFHRVMLGSWPRGQQVWYSEVGLLVHEDWTELRWFYGNRHDWYDHAVGIVNESWMDRAEMSRRRDALAWLMKAAIDQIEYKGLNFEDPWEENLSLVGD